MRFSKEWVEALLSRVDIVIVIQEARIGLKKRFRKNPNEFACLCPFHKEKTPSFTVPRHKQFYHCFGCGAHGNTIDFLMNFNSMSFGQVVVFLAKRFKVKLPNKTIKMSNVVLRGLNRTETLNKDVVLEDYQNYIDMLNSAGWAESKD